MSDLRDFAPAASASAPGSRLGWGSARPSPLPSPPVSSGPRSALGRVLSPSSPDDDDASEDDAAHEGRGLLNGGGSSRSRKGAGGPASARGLVVNDIALSQQGGGWMQSASALLPSPLRRVQPVPAARQLSRREYEIRERKRWYWVTLLSCIAIVVLGILELGMSAHLLLEDTWAGLDVLALQLVVWSLAILAAVSVVLSFQALWALAHLVDPGALMGVPRTAGRGRMNSDGGLTLLTDSPALDSMPAPSPTGETPALSPAAYSSAQLLSQLQESDDGPSFAEAQRMADSISLDEDGSESKRPAPSASASSSPPASQRPGSVVVTVQQVAVEGDAARSRPLSPHSVTRSASSSDSADPLQMQLRADAPDDILASFFNLSTGVVVMYFGFASMLLAQGSQVAAYVHAHAVAEHGGGHLLRPRHAHGVHMDDDDLDLDPAAHAEMLRLKLAAYLSIMAVLALFTAKLLLSATVGSWFLQKRRVLTAQAYLVAHWLIGMCGSALIGSSAYISHHQTFVPLTAGEISWMDAVGRLLFVCGIGGLVRFYFWSPSSSSRGRMLHVLCLGALSVSLFLLCGSLHLRAQEAPFYGHGELAGHESTMWQLELAAQMKIGALTILTLIVAVFACLTLVLAVQLDSIRHGHLQRAAALQAQMQQSRRQSVSVSREELP